MVKLSEISTKAPEGSDKKNMKEETEAFLIKLKELQTLLYSESKHAVLIILQGMDASGKDGVISNVIGSLNPQGFSIKAFKAPTEDELKHDFLWRVHKCAPAKGMIQVFNRSHYEDVLITRVNGWCDDNLAAQRFKAINYFEELLVQHNATTILKFYLHISQKEQKDRFEERVENPAKHWKYNKKDLDEAKLWDTYMQVYEECFDHCNSLPWTIVPADQNWYKEYIIVKKLVETLEGLNMQYPQLKEI